MNSKIPLADIIMNSALAPAEVEIANGLRELLGIQVAQEDDVAARLARVLVRNSIPVDEMQLVLKIATMDDPKKMPDVFDNFLNSKMSDLSAELVGVSPMLIDLFKELADIRVSGIGSDKATLSLQKPFEGDQTTDRASSANVIRYHSWELGFKDMTMPVLYVDLTDISENSQGHLGKCFKY